jgi:hypothetical protein
MISRKELDCEELYGPIALHYQAVRSRIVEDMLARLCLRPESMYSTMVER